MNPVCGETCAAWKHWVGSADLSSAAAHLLPLLFACFPADCLKDINWRGGLTRPRTNAELGPTQHAELQEEVSHQKGKGRARDRCPEDSRWLLPPFLPPFAPLSSQSFG